MARFLKALVIVPLAAVLLAFAVANRQMVTVSFDPFDSSDPTMALTLPLFIVIIVAVVVGVIAGGIATWFGQRHWRRAARRHEAEARDARQRLTEINARVPLAPAGHERPGSAPQAPYSPPPLAIGQDKDGTAL
jgi:uncharacterized integral membrane protein